MHPGDFVTWMHEYRGGYGYTHRIPAQVVKVGPKRVQICVMLERGGFKHIWVTPEKLMPRRA